MHPPPPPNLAYPPPPARPRIPLPWHRNPKVVFPIVLVAVVAAVSVFVVVLVQTAQNRSGTLAMDPGAVFEDSPAVSFDYTYTARDGLTTGGRFTVTDDGYATGTVNDQFSGAATVHATPEGQAVWGDEDWWSRRVPGQAGKARDRWVQPDAGTALPIDPAADLSPAALAELARSIGDNGSVNLDITAYQGVPAVAMTWQDWTLIRTVALPTEVLALFGPLDSDLLAGTGGGRATVRPASWDGDSAHPQAVAIDDNFTITRPVPESPEVKEYAKRMADRTRNGENGDPAADPDTATPPAEIEPPPALADLPVLAPEFSASINAPYCTSPTCSVSVTVTNSGTGPGTAQVTTSIIPGMPAVTATVGPIAPGGSAPPLSYSIPNPAPTPAPGQTTTGSAQVLVQIYSYEIAGSTPGRYNDLLTKLGGQSRQPALDRMLAPLAEAAKTAMVEAMHRILDSGVSPEDTMSLAEQTTQADPGSGDYSEIQLVRQLADAGSRFASWDTLAEQLAGLPAEILPLTAHGLEATLAALADSAANVSLYLEPLPGSSMMDMVVVADRGADAIECTQITATGGNGFAAAIDAAALRLNDAASPAAEVVGRCATAVQAVVTDPTSPLRYSDAATVYEQVVDDFPALTVCADPAMGLGGMSIVNGGGTYTWAQGTACTDVGLLTEEQKIERLNALGLPEQVRTELSAQARLRIGADSAIEEVTWNDPDKPCKSTYSYGPSPRVTTAPPGTRAGRKASGAAAYLCDEMAGGTEAGRGTPWAWPNTNQELAPKVYEFARCHLIGRQLGGKGIGNPGNLVTCLQFPTNSPVMSGFEGQVAAKVAGQHVSYSVVPVYGADDAPLTGIRLLAIGRSGYFLDVCIPNDTFRAVVFNGNC